MPKSRQRVCLEEGLSLSLNKLIRQRAVRPGMMSGPNRIHWTRTYRNEQIASAEESASGVVTTNLENQYGGRLRIQVGSLDQRIELASQPRHFGGRQWYFVCPVTHRHCSVLWMPPGATLFCSRQTWDRQVAYASQFETSVDRAHLGKAKIKSRLIGDFDPDEWDFPPKPKWMRWHTYDNQVEKFDRYEHLLQQECSRALMRIFREG